MQLKQNKQLWQKYKKNAQFQDKMKQKSSKFKQFQQLSLYLQSHQSSKNMIISIKRQTNQDWSCKLQQRTNTVIILGLKQPNGNKSIENILLNMVKFIPRPTQNYSVIYINTLASSNAYNDFKSIIQFLPIQYLYCLQKIFVLQAHFKNKASYWWSFDFMTNFIKNKTVHVETLKDILERIKINSNKLLNELPLEVVKALAEQEELARNYLKSKQSQIIYNSNVYNAEKQAYIQPKSKPKLLKNQPNKNTIESYELGQTGAPLTIQLLISYFNGKQQLLDTEGLFRKSVSIEEQTQLLKQLSKGNYNYIQQVTNPHLIANAIKRFLSNLDQPIIPFNEFNLLMSVHQSQFKANIITIVNRLANNRKMTLLLLVDFLVQKLLPKTASNKMTYNSLSIVFAPCLMRSQVPSINDLVNTKKSITIALIILQDCSDIFGNKKERMVEIRKSIKSQQRESFLVRLKNIQEENLEFLEKSQPTQSFQNNNKNEQIKIQSNSPNKEDTNKNNILNSINKMIEQQINHIQTVEFDESLQLILIQNPINEPKTNFQ